MNATATTPTTTFPLPSDATANRLARFGFGAVRIGTGLLFAVTGLNGFLDFLPHPTDPMPEKAAAFVGALVTTYLFRLVAATQLAAGVLLLANRFVPLALALLAPVVVNILCFHVFLAPQGLPLAVVISAAEAGLAWRYRRAYRGILAAHAV
jgi:uncharacterized membrane protein YphA (DoxX/SURF4 family)